jgi:hypothetical protein
MHCRRHGDHTAMFRRGAEGDGGVEEQGVARQLASGGTRPEEGETGEKLLQVHHLAGDVLGDGQSDDVGVGVDVGDHVALLLHW